MEVIFFLLVVVFGLALAAGAGTYQVAHYHLIKTRNPDAKLISWFLSLCCFAVVIVVIYFIVLSHLLIER